MVEGNDIIGGLKAAGVYTGFGNEWVKVGGIKYVADGSTSERTMRMSTPYVGTNDYGLLTMTQQEIDEAVEDGHRHNHGRQARRLRHPGDGPPRCRSQSNQGHQSRADRRRWEDDVPDICVVTRVNDPAQRLTATRAAHARRSPAPRLHPRRPNASALTEFRQSVAADG